MEFNVVAIGICVCFLGTAYTGKLCIDCCVMKIREDRTGTVFAWYYKVAVFLMAVGACIDLAAAISCLLVPDFWKNRIIEALVTVIVYMVAERLVTYVLEGKDTSLKGER